MYSLRRKDHTPQNRWAPYAWKLFKETTQP